jgi:peroxiredoxin
MIEAGQEVPDFTLSDQDGEPVSCRRCAAGGGRLLLRQAATSGC